MKPLLPFFMIVAALPALCAGAEQADAVGQALDGARKAAKEAGVELPKIERKDVDRLVGKVKDEVEKAQQKEKEKAGEPGTASAPAPLPLAQLPAWIPPVPASTFSPEGAKWVAEGIESGKTRGTATLSPKEVADAWAAKAPPDFKAIRKTTTTDGVTVEVTRLVSKADPARWAEIKAEPDAAGAPTKVRLRYQMPGQPPAPGSAPAPASTTPGR